MDNNDYEMIFYCFYTKIYISAHYIMNTEMWLKFSKGDLKVNFRWDSWFSSYCAIRDISVSWLTIMGHIRVKYIVMLKIYGNELIKLLYLYACVSKTYHTCTLVSLKHTKYTLYHKYWTQWNTLNL